MINEATWASSTFVGNETLFSRDTPWKSEATNIIIPLNMNETFCNSKALLINETKTSRENMSGEWSM